MRSLADSPKPRLGISLAIRRQVFPRSRLAEQFEEHEREDDRRHEDNLQRFDDLRASLMYLKGRVDIMVALLAVITGLISYGMFK